MNEKPSFNKRFLASIAYIFAIPSLYIILTDREKDSYLGYHGKQAFFLWLIIIFIWLMLRWLIIGINSLYYSPYFIQVGQVVNWSMWIYAIWCSIRAASGEMFKLPIVSKFS